MTVLILLVLLTSCVNNENGLLTKNPIGSENSITLQSNEKRTRNKKSELL